MSLVAKGELTLPCYVVNVPRLLERFENFRSAFNRHFARSSVAVSYKTNYLPAMLTRLHQAGAWAEVVSPLELSLADRLGVKPEHVVVNGPAKSREFLRRAIERRHVLHLDSLEEAEAVAALAADAARPVSVGLRVNLPKFDSDPAGPSRFGISIANGRLKAATDILRRANVSINGIHAHLSSRLRKLEYFETLARHLAEAVTVVGEQELTYLDIGGGFGYVPANMSNLAVPSFDEYAAAIHRVLSSRISRLDELAVITEPGIALVGDVLDYYCHVTGLKEIDGRSLVAVDGSVHTIKPTRHRVNLPTRVLRADFSEKEAPKRTCDVVGYTCLEDDLIAIDLEVPEPAVGDIMVFENVGAYTWVLKPAFIRSMPAFYLYDGESCELARPVETVDEFYAGYVIP